MTSVTFFSSELRLTDLATNFTLLAIVLFDIVLLYITAASAAFSGLSFDYTYVQSCQFRIPTLQDILFLFAVV